MTSFCIDVGVMCAPKIGYLFKNVSSTRRPQWRLHTRENFRR